jgi:hypothetical protein
VELLASLFSAWSRQLGAALLLPAIVGVLLHVTERGTQESLRRVFGWRGVVWWTGWLGTPIHELSHCIVGTCFAHKIDEVKLWEPDPRDGVLGYVRYRLPTSRLLRPYAVIGQFFSGIAPLFGGSLVLLLALRIVVPDAHAVFDAADRYSETLSTSRPAGVLSGFVALVRSVYGSVFAEGVASPRPWIFLYIALAVGAHLAPSPADMKGGLPGFLLLVFALLLVDAVVLLLGGAPGRAAGFLGHASGMLTALLFIALTLNVGNLGVASLIALVAGKRGPA